MTRDYIQVLRATHVASCKVCVRENMDMYIVLYVKNDRLKKK